MRSKLLPLHHKWVLDDPATISAIATHDLPANPMTNAHHRSRKASVVCLFAAGMCGGSIANALELKIYGGADIGISYLHTAQNGSSANEVSMNSNVVDDSMIGFTGTEALNNEWSVGFDLASEINIYDGTLSYDQFFGIESTLSLTHRQWGTLSLGRQQTISTDFFTAIDPMGMSYGQAEMATSFTAINTQIYSNMIQFTSSKWSGFQFGLGYSFNTGETALYANSGTVDPFPSDTGFGTGNKMRALTAAVQYESGPVLLVASFDKAYASRNIASYSDASDTSETISNPETASPQTWYLGVAYTIDEVVLSAAWGRGINGAFSGSGPGAGVDNSPLSTFTGDADMLFSQGFNQNAYMLGFNWSVDDRTQLMFSWQMLQPTGQLQQMPGIGTQQIVGAALSHNLSPRTSVYIWGSYGNNFQLSAGAKASVIGTGIQTVF
jgi:predicted porin